MAINGITGITPASGLAPSAAPTSTSSSSASETGFGDTLRQLIGAVNGSAGEANQAVSQMLDGSGDIHEAMIALQRADAMLQLTVQIRNKLVQAYQDVMRMPL